MILKANDIQTLAKLANEAAQIAGTYIQSQVNLSHDINLKEGIKNLATQVVTAIDIESQRLILEHLNASISNYELGLLTEELIDDGSRFQKDYFWCIDPLDGTLPFTEQKPGYAVSIALVNRMGEPIIGVVVDPFDAIHWVAVKGCGVIRNDQPYQYAAQTKTMTVQFDRSFMNSANYHQTIEALETICKPLGFEDIKIRTGYGAVMNAMSLLGKNSGCYVKWPKTTHGGGCIWDYAATRLIFEELNLPVSTAMGSAIPLNQENIFMNSQGVIYTSHKALHQALIQKGKELL